MTWFPVLLSANGVSFEPLVTTDSLREALNAVAAVARCAPHVDIVLCDGSDNSIRQLLTVRHGRWHVHIHAYEASEPMQPPAPPCAQTSSEAREFAIGGGR